MPGQSMQFSIALFDIDCVKCKKIVMFVTVLGHQLLLLQTHEAAEMLQIGVLRTWSACVQRAKLSHLKKTKVLSGHRKL